MQLKPWGALLAGLLISSPVHGVNTDNYELPYFGALGTYSFMDDVRPADDGAGYQLTFGVPLSWDRYAVEMSFFDTGFDRDLDGQKDYQSGLSIGVVRDFGAFGWGADSVLPTFKPFVIAGLAAVQEDILSSKHLHLGFDAGVGTLIQLPWWGAAVRAEARLLAQSNDESVAGEDFLEDFRLALGVQIPLSPYEGRKMNVEDAPDCKLAVVDPNTGRRDCVSDSDRDGVPDTLDRCPGTPLGTQVDPYGCAIAVADSDGDGVPDARDQCPNTRPGLQVNSEGCAISQTLVLKRVQFELDSATLTSDSRSILNEVAQTLVGQQNIVVEIAGHTDSRGSQAYNLALSQSRAEACRNYLIGAGVDPSRMTSVGYGEFKPVTGNETESGRAKNRRVEFHLVVE